MWVYISVFVWLFILYYVLANERHMVAFMIDKSIGRRIKQRREELGYTQEQFAEKTGLTIFDYIRLERYDDLPASVVIFTDGEGPYPDESETMGLPVLWVLHDSAAYPPFGKTIRLISPEKVL